MHQYASRYEALCDGIRVIRLDLNHADTREERDRYLENSDLLLTSGLLSCSGTPCNVQIFM